MKILIFKEKHGTRYMKASTPEEIQESCLKILRERLKFGYYDLPECPEPPKISLEDGRNLPEMYKNSVEQEWKTYERNLKYYDRCAKCLEAAQKEVTSPMGLAKAILSGRIDHQYEWFEIRELE